MIIGAPTTYSRYGTLISIYIQPNLYAETNRTYSHIQTSAHPAIDIHTHTHTQQNATMFAIGLLPPMLQILLILLL